MSYQDFKDAWSGKVDDFDHVYAYQCVDPILRYAYDHGVTGIWGNAIDYRNDGAANTANLKKAFDWVPGADCTQGDIVVLRTAGTSAGDYSGYGHIGICDSVDGSNFKMLEQNGATGNGQGQGNDKISVWRSIPKSRIIGVWRPKGATPPPVTPPVNGQQVYLPASTPGGTWRLYRIGSALRPNTSDQIAVLQPGYFTGNNPPGITYKVESWVGDYAVVISTQDFGRGVIWIKDTDAQIS